MIKGIPTLRIGSNIGGVAYVYDLKMDIVGTYWEASKMLYIYYDYGFFEKLFYRLCKEGVSFQVIHDEKRPRSLREVPKD